MRSLCAHRPGSRVDIDAPRPVRVPSDGPKSARATSEMCAPMCANGCGGSQSRRDAPSVCIGGRRSLGTRIRARERGALDDPASFRKIVHDNREASSETRLRARAVAKARLQPSKASFHNAARSSQGSKARA